MGDRSRILSLYHLDTQNNHPRQLSLLPSTARKSIIHCRWRERLPSKHEDVGPTSIRRVPRQQLRRRPTSTRRRADVHTCWRGTRHINVGPTSSCLLGPPKHCPFPWGDPGLQQKWFHGPTRVHTPNTLGLLHYVKSLPKTAPEIYTHKTTTELIFIQHNYIAHIFAKYRHVCLPHYFVRLCSWHAL